jgi:rare lipoprotein A
MKQTVLLTSLFVALQLVCPAAQAQSTEIAPEVSSRVWQSDSAEFGSVCLNGKELVAFHSGLGDGVAGEKADELAIKLTDLINDKSFDADYLLPGKDGNMAVLKISNNPVLNFDSTDTDTSSPLAASFRVANAIRTACNAPALPACLLKLDSQVASTVSVTEVAAVKSEGRSSSFSGRASWYGGRFHGRKTSDGSRYDQEQLTAAHRSLPFGTRLLVMNRRTGQACVVRVNDRGPFVGNRVIDLSRGAARELNMLSSGVAMVDCLVLGNNPSSQIH